MDEAAVFSEGEEWEQELGYEEDPSQLTFSAEGISRGALSVLRGKQGAVGPLEIGTGSSPSEFDGEGAQGEGGGRGRGVGERGKGKGKGQGRPAVRRATQADKELARAVHRTHLLCLLARALALDRAASSPLLQVGAL